MSNYKKFVNNKSKGRSRASPSVCIEYYEGSYYVNGHSIFVHFDAAIEYAYKKLPKVPLVHVYVRPGVVYMHIRKPSKLYTQVSDERMDPKEAWPLFEGHAGMLS